MEKGTNCRIYIKDSRDGHVTSKLQFTTNYEELVASSNRNFVQKYIKETVEVVNVLITVDIVVTLSKDVISTDTVDVTLKITEVKVRDSKYIVVTIKDS